MADEREGQQKTGTPANEDKIQTGGRQSNAAQPLNAADDNGGPERYPAVRQDDAVERTGRTGQVTGEKRSFCGDTGNPEPRQGAGDASPAAADEGRLGPAGDPAEGKR
jgi:hypothetical protein